MPEDILRGPGDLPGKGKVLYYLDFRNQWRPLRMSQGYTLGLGLKLEQKSHLFRGTPQIPPDGLLQSSTLSPTGLSDWTDQMHSSHVPGIVLSFLFMMATIPTRVSDIHSLWCCGPGKSFAYGSFGLP